MAGASALLFGEQTAVAAAGAWADARSYIAGVRFVETPFAVTLSFDFRGDEVVLGVEQNVSFGDTQLVRTVGRS